MNVQKEAKLPYSSKGMESTETLTEGTEICVSIAKNYLVMFSVIYNVEL